MNTLTHTASFHILFTVPDRYVLDQIITIVKYIIAIIMFLSIIWQSIEPVIWFVISLVESIVFSVKVVEVAIKAIWFAMRME